MKVLFVDVETTGLPKRDLKWDQDWQHFPHVVSAAWRLTEDGETGENYWIVNLGNVRIPQAATRVHGITNEMSMQSQYDQKTVLFWLLQDALRADRIVGHNLYFDTSVIKANIIREFGAGSDTLETAIQALHKTKRVDIMRQSARYNGGWSTLELLHSKLFGEGHRAHHAAADVAALQKCYYKLIEFGVIDEKTGREIREPDVAAT